MVGQLLCSKRMFECRPEQKIWNKRVNQMQWTVELIERKPDQFQFSIFWSAYHQIAILDGITTEVILTFVPVGWDCYQGGRVLLCLCQIIEKSIDPSPATTTYWVIWLLDVASFCVSVKMFWPTARHLFMQNRQNCDSSTKADYVLIRRFICIEYNPLSVIHATSFSCTFPFHCHPAHY